MLRPPQRSTLFPYTTLFRSHRDPRGSGVVSHRPDEQQGHFQIPVRIYLGTGDDVADGRRGEELPGIRRSRRSEEYTSELQSHSDLVCRLLLEKKKKQKNINNIDNEVVQGIIQNLRIWIGKGDDIVLAHD